MPNRYGITTQLRTRRTYHRETCAVLPALLRAHATRCPGTTNSAWGTRSHHTYTCTNSTSPLHAIALCHMDLSSALNYLGPSPPA